jgi:hypothetical protein
MRIRRFLWAMVIPAIGFLAIQTGCSDSTKPKPKEQDRYLPASSAFNVMANLKTAYDEMDLDGYMALLDSAFVFEFTEEDQGQPGVPLGLNYSDEERIHTNLFALDLVDRLDLEFELGDLNYDELASETAADSIWRLEMTSFDITLHGRVPESPEMVPVTWEVANGRCLFWFNRTDDAQLWQIWKWRETTLSGGKSGGLTETSTWGSLKLTFN